MVRISATEAKLARTPAMKPEEHRAHAVTAVEIAANGAVSGRTDEDNTGILGSTLRSPPRALFSRSATRSWPSDSFRASTRPVPAISTSAIRRTRSTPSR